MGLNLRYSPLEWNSVDKRLELDSKPMRPSDADLELIQASAVIRSTAAAIKTGVSRAGDIIKTDISIDLTGLASITTTGDIIGAAGICYIGRVVASVMGTIIAGQVGCSVLPTTGDDDIDIYSATEGTGAYDGAIGDLVETALVASAGAYAVGTVKPFTALPVADAYLYLTTGDTTAGTYDAGKIFIEMWGTAV